MSETSRFFDMEKLTDVARQAIAGTTTAVEVGTDNGIDTITLSFSSERGLMIVSALFGSGHYDYLLPAIASMMAIEQ